MPDKPIILRIPKYLIDRSTTPPLVPNRILPNEGDYYYCDVNDLFLAVLKSEGCLPSIFTDFFAREPALQQALHDRIDALPAQAAAAAPIIASLTLDEESAAAASPHHTPSAIAPSQLIPPLLLNAHFRVQLHELSTETISIRDLNNLLRRYGTSFILSLCPETLRHIIEADWTLLHLEKCYDDTQNAITIATQAPTEREQKLSRYLSLAEMFYANKNLDSVFFYCQQALTLCDAPQDKPPIRAYLLRAYQALCGHTITEALGRDVITETLSDDLPSCYKILRLLVEGARVLPNLLDELERAQQMAGLDTFQLIIVENNILRTEDPTLIRAFDDLWGERFARIFAAEFARLRLTIKDLDERMEYALQRGNDTNGLRNALDQVEKKLELLVSCISRHPIAFQSRCVEFGVVLPVLSAAIPPIMLRPRPMRGGVGGVRAQLLWRQPLWRHQHGGAAAAPSAAAATAPPAPAQVPPAPQSAAAAAAASAPTPPIHPHKPPGPRG